MSELKGAIFAGVIFIAVIFPGLLMFGIDSLHQHAFMKMTTEMHELVKEEGGVGEKTKQMVQSLEQRGYTISFKDQYGNPINGKVNYGDTVNIQYNYTYKSVMEERQLETNNRVFIMKRNNP